MRPVYVLPNLITSASLFCGLCSIVATSQGQFIVASYLILISAVLDGLDGPVARWTRSSSSFGLQYDSLSDVVAFGVAPALLMYNKLAAIDSVSSLPVWAPRMAMGVCALYAICGAIRLARFNIQVGNEEKTHFTGMPIPAAAGVVVSAFLVVEQYLPETLLAEIDLGRNLHRAILMLMLIVAYLMVSTYPFPSLKGIHRRTRHSMNALVSAVFLICMLVAFRRHIPLIAFLAFMAYICVSLINIVRQKRRLAHFSPGVPLGATSGPGERPLP